MPFALEWSAQAVVRRPQGQSTPWWDHQTE